MCGYRLKVILIGLFTIGVLEVERINAQPCYADFINTYKPHNKSIAPDNKAVCLVSYMSEEAAATLMEEYIRNNDCRMFTLIITSLDRKKAGAIIDKMDKSYIIKGLKMLSAEWVYELIYYVSEKTYKIIDNRLPVMEKYALH